MAQDINGDSLEYMLSNFVPAPQPQWMANTSVPPIHATADLRNLPSYVVPVLYQHQGNQCVPCSSNPFVPSEYEFQRMEDEAHFFSDLVTTESYYAQQPPSMYLDELSSIMGISQLEIDNGASYSVRSLYRAGRMNSTGTDWSLDPDYTETASEFDTAIMSLDPSTCFSLYQDSLLLQGDSDRGVDTEMMDRNFVYLQDVSEQTQLDSEDIKLIDMLVADKRLDEEETYVEKDSKKAYGHGRLVKIFFEYFIGSLVTVNAYLYNYFLRYILFI